MRRALLIGIFGVFLQKSAWAQLLPKSLGEFSLPSWSPPPTPNEPDKKSANAGGSDAVIPTVPQEIEIIHEGSIQGDFEQGVIHYKANKGLVEVRGDNGVQLFAKHLSLDTKRKILFLKGQVSAYQGLMVYRGEEAQYDYGSNELNVGQLRSSLSPLFLEAKGFRLEEDEDGKELYIGEQTGITTHDVEHPNFWMRAKKTTVYPGEKVTFKGLKLYVKDIPVFWLPYLSQPLDRELGYHFSPGARSNLGFYLKNSYGLMIGSEKGGRKPWLLSKWHADLYSKRGVGFGLDFIDTRLDYNPNLGWLNLYYIDDLDPNLKRANKVRQNVNPNRYRVRAQYRKEVDWVPEAQTYFDLNVDWLSDRYFLEDFDVDFFRRNSAPDNTLSFVYQKNYMYFSALARMRINRFYQSDTRYPELHWGRVRAPLLGSGVLYETQNSLGRIKEYLDEEEREQLENSLSTLSPSDTQFSVLEDLLNQGGYLRAHTWHELSYPMRYRDWLTLTPRAGIGASMYRDAEGAESSHNRFLNFLGLDASMKFSKVYPTAQSKKWGIDEFLHIVEPYLSFSTIAAGDPPAHLSVIDRLTPSTRPPPIHLGRYTALDEVFDATTLRLGMHNRLFTKRNGGTHSWLTLNTYFDIFLDDPQFNRNISNFYNDLEWSPLPWLNLGLETQFPILQGGSGFTEVVTRASFKPHEDWQISLRHRYLDNHPILLNSNRLDVNVYARLNEYWGLEAFNRWELDTGALELQRYTLHRNVESWIISAGVFHRDNQGQDDWGGLISFTLRELPRVSLPFRIEAE